MNRKNNHLSIFIASLTLLLGLIFLPLQAVDKTQAAKITRFEEVDEAIVRLQERILADPENPDLHCGLAEFLLMKGQYDEAEQSLQKALKIEPHHVKSLIVLSNLYRRKIEFEKGLELMQELKSLIPAHFKVRLLEARYAIDRMDFVKAWAIYQSLLQDNPQSPEVVYGIAEVCYWQDRFEQAEEYIAECLSLDPEFSPAYQLQSKIHRLRQENDKWKELGRKAVDLSPFDDDARANLAIILMRGEGQMEEGHEHYRIALKINPYSIESHLYLGTGWNSKDYEDQKLDRDEETVKLIKDLLKKGDEHLLNLELRGADQAFSKVLEFMPTNITALIGKGTLSYHKKDYDTALDWFFKVLDISPDYGLAHYGISRSLLRKKDKLNIRFVEIERNFAAKDVPEPPFLREVFINYDRLDPNLQKIIRFSVQPLKHYLKTLHTAGATFYLIPFHKLLWESPYLAGMKGTHTFDLRLWDDVKGCGGFHSTSGEDWEKDVKYLRFNVVAHEFAHQVHGYLTEEQQKEIKRLFTIAKKERITLDFYADFNEWEYFAVGVEAYVSEEKLADQKLGYGHIRKELLDKDPDLYNLIESLGKLESYQESEILAFIPKTNSAYRREGTEKHYPKGLYAELQTNKGLIVLQLEFKKVPMTTANFVGLAEGTIKNSALPEGVRYYDGTIFHMVVPNHVIQAGAPSETEKTGPGYAYPNEIYPKLSHNRAGILGVANGGPHTNGSQFYITLSDRSYLDGNYTIFGHVVEGMDVVNRIVREDFVESIRIIRVGGQAKKFRPDTASFNKLVEDAKERVQKEEEKKKRKEEKIIRRNWPEAITAESGARYIIVKEGTGAKPEAGAKLKVIYTGQFMDGRRFSSSADQGKPVPVAEATPFEYVVGKSRVNPGFDAALMDMKKGEKRILILPSRLAYRTSGFYGKEKKGEKRFVISPNTTLVYEVELLDIVK